MQPTSNVNAAGVVIDNVSKVFGRKRVLNSVDIAIEPQEFLPLSVRRAAARQHCCALSPVSTSPMADGYFTTGVKLQTSLRGNAKSDLCSKTMPYGRI